MTWQEQLIRLYSFKDVYQAVLLYTFLNQNSLQNININSYGIIEQSLSADRSWRDETI